MYLIFSMYLFSNLAFSSDFSKYILENISGDILQITTPTLKFISHINMQIQYAMS